MVLRLALGAALLLPLTAVASCPVDVGMMTEMEPVSEVFSRFESGPTKGEFEKSEDFNKRLTEHQAGLSASILMENEWPYRIVEYDADNERFLVRATAFGEEPPLLYSTAERFPDNVKVESKNFAVSVAQDLKLKGSYTASNAFGAQAKVNRKSETVYVVFDSSGGKTGRSVWKPDARIKSEGSNFKFDTVYIDAPLEEAKALKDNLRWGISFEPKNPFFFETWRVSNPTLRNPNDRLTTYKVLAADIQCAFATNGEGKVLKIVAPR